ncbi:hypothetical protein QC764_0078050 [Podospora pseudoanserina]|uniref:Heterokaryon incompatibility domain-containing protein n=1 Tax=Podospora pseudoanserina TaxID=2609844 RepID=A0ABR0I5I9_9PEZI|nr:hypothetical protein QC764_0078050 [Podospora pseudoanserina]
MSHPHSRQICTDCTVIFQKAGSVLTSGIIETVSSLPLDQSYRDRIIRHVHQNQCDMCSLISNTIPAINDPLDSKRTAELRFTLLHNPTSVNLRLWEFCAEDQKARSHAGGLSIQDVRNGRSTRILSAPTTWSAETLGQIKDWLETCLSSHAQCANRSSGRLPRRLIDVWSTTEPLPKHFDQLSLENSQNIRVVVSESLPQDTKYLTLSHRWGNPPKLLLTTQTQFLLKEDIVPHLLACDEAAVFRHAIQVTRGLGFRYIWIDALCIEQDNGPEKAVDIMHMDEVYTNSSLNLSASVASVLDGLVFDRDLSSINPCRATVVVEAGQESVALQATPEGFHSLRAVGPLYERGWVYQERLLAPRIAHFLSDQVYWECHALDASEVLPEGYQDGLERQTRGMAAITKGLSADELELRWFRLVEDYTATALTYPDDRLLAVSALAKQFSSVAKRNPNDYLAGMWKDSLLPSLVWLLAEYEEGSEPQRSSDAPRETEVAPSWSWASIMDTVSWPQSSEYTRIVPSVELVDVEVDRTSQNLFDGTNLCRLRLRGHMRKIYRYIENGQPWISISGTVRFPEVLEINEEFFDHPLALSWDTCRESVALALKDDSDWLPGRTYFLLHIGAEQTAYCGDWEPAAEEGIILEKTPEHGTYRRVGHFLVPYLSIQDYESFELAGAFHRGFEGLLDENSGDYHELDPDGSTFTSYISTGIPPLTI